MLLAGRGRRSLSEQLVVREWTARPSVENRDAQAAGRGRGELLEKVRKSFFDARGILDFDAGNFQPQNRKTHCHAMIVVGLDWFFG